MSLDNDTLLFALTNILNSLPEEKNTIKLNPIVLGKRIKNIPLKSKYTLTLREIVFYRDNLIKAYKSWSKQGHPDWWVVETDGLHFTVIFIRKNTPEAERYMERIMKGKVNK